MTKVKLKPFDVTEYLNTPEDMSNYLEAVLKDGDPQLIAAALGDIAKAKGMTDVANKTGLTRASLYKSLSADGNPELATITKVIQALGLKLSIETA